MPMSPRQPLRSSSLPREPGTPMIDWSVARRPTVSCRRTRLSDCRTERFWRLRTRSSHGLSRGLGHRAALEALSETAGSRLISAKTLMSENLAHPLVCGRYSCPRREPWCPFEIETVRTEGCRINARRNRATVSVMPSTSDKLLRRGK
jgi:hypothetical protein